MTRPGWAPSADFGALPSPDWHARGQAHNDALQARGGLPVCEMRDWPPRSYRHCWLCNVQEPADLIWTTTTVRDGQLVRYGPGCAPFRVPPE